MNVLLLPSSYTPNIGGVEEMTRGLAAQLRRLGHSVAIVAPRWPATLPSEDLIDGTPVRRLVFPMPARGVCATASFLSGFSRTSRELTAIARGFAPDIIHVHCLGPNALYATWVAGKLKTPLVVTTHGELQDADAGHSMTMWLTRRWALGRAAYVTACSGYTLRQARVPRGIPSAVIYNAIGDTPEPTVISATTQPPFIFCAARLGRNKGIDLAVDAFARAKARLGGVELWIAGDGPQHATLCSMAKSLGVSDSVRLLGRLDSREVRRLMRQATFVLCPSRNEAFGLVNLEAMAAGRAVIASNVGGVPELVENGKTGLLVPPDDPEALAASITRLVHEPQTREQMGAAGRESANRFQWPQIVKQFLAVYSDAAAASKPWNAGRVKRAFGCGLRGMGQQG